MTISNTNRLAALGIVALALFITGCGGGSIKNVKKGYSPAYPDVTIEGGYKFALKSPKWKEFKTEKGQCVVEVRGEVKKDALREYVLNEFLSSSSSYTEEEEEYLKKYRSILPYHRHHELLGDSVTEGSLCKLVEEELDSFGGEHASVLKKQKSLHSDLHGDLPDLVVAMRMSELYPNEKRTSLSDKKFSNDMKRIDDEMRAKDVGELIALTDTLEKKGLGNKIIPFFTRYPRLYEACAKAKTELDSIAGAVKDANWFTEKTQEGLVKDHARALRARDQFLKAFLKKSDPMITAQFVMHVDGKRFASGAVTARLDGGPWDDRELTLDTSEWESLIFSD
jgi:hypothetical protein